MNARNTIADRKKVHVLIFSSHPLFMKVNEIDHSINVYLSISNNRTHLLTDYFMYGKAFIGKIIHRRA